jgi:hypothetical protein
MGTYLGDFAEDATIQHAFNTFDASGAPITLVSGAIGVTKDGSAMTLDGGSVTLSVDDIDTGRHTVTIDSSIDADFATGSEYGVFLTAGTVDGTTVEGTSLFEFSIENRYQGPNTTSAYFATIKVDTRGAADRYMVQWYKDAQLAGTVTLPDLQVIDSAGSDLIAAGGNDTELVVDGNAVYYTEATSRMVPGSLYIIKVTATIDGSPRVFKVPYMLDASKEASELAYRATVNTAIAASTTSFFSSDFETLNGAMGSTAVKDRWALFTSGNNRGIARLITAYDGNGNFTTEAFPQTPANNDVFRVVGAYKGA